MTWSFEQARRAADQVRAAPLGRQAVATVRPRSVFGLVRSRAPLPLLLYLAARDGLVVVQDNGGFAVLRRPLMSAPVMPGGYRVRLLRWADRRWDFLVFAGPALAGLLFALLGMFSGLLVAAVVAAVGAAVWVTVFLTGMAVYQFREVFRIGRLRRHRDAELLPGYHWSVPLVHQPDPSWADGLLRISKQRLATLIHAELQSVAGESVRVGHLDVTETLVILLNGITVPQTRDAIAASARALPGYRVEGVIVLGPLARPRATPRRPIIGGGFLLLYLGGLAVVIAVCAATVANTEAHACLPASCGGRPATYPLALRWLLQRLLLSDPPGLAPATVPVIVLGWLVSLAAVVGALVAAVAGHQEIQRTRQAHALYHEAVQHVTGAARVLVLVATPGERDAVLAAARAHTSHDAVDDQHGKVLVQTLGRVSGSELVLVQAGETGTTSAQGMLLTATEAINQTRPDYVILTGICFGLRRGEGQQLGDIIVARRVHDIDPRKETGDARHATIHRGSNVGASPRLLSYAQAAQRTWAGPTVHFGLVLSSNVLVNSKALVDRLCAEFPDAIAGEMEAAGVYEATTRDLRPDWIMVKAISDWGYDKSDAAQPRAAANAAGFVMHVIASGALHERRLWPAS